MNIKNILFLIGTPVLSFVFFVFVNGVSYSKYAKSCYENKVFYYLPIFILGFLILLIMGFLFNKQNIKFKSYSIFCLVVVYYLATAFVSSTLGLSMPCQVSIPAQFIN